MAPLSGFLASVPTPVVYSLLGVGFLSVFSKVWSYFSCIASIFLLSGTSLRKYGKKGSWAVVTGASDGIGKEYATQLAKAGFNIVLVSRTESKLLAFAEELSKMGVESKVLAMDFAKCQDVDFERLAALVSGLDVAILINNVGQSHSIPVPFIETEKTEMENIITINCMGTLKVTKIIAPLLVARKNGLILTMGSFGGLMPTPLLATYSGSKAFLQHWSTALGSELKPSGVDVELVISYLVTSAMSKIRKSSATIPTPKQFVRSVLTKINRGGGAQTFAYTSTPFWSHALMHWWLENTVGLYGSFIADQNKNFHVDIRKRALKKAAREAAKNK